MTKAIDHHYPWAEWFVCAVRVFGLNQDEFWRLSVAEWKWLLQQTGSEDDRLSKDALDSLLNTYPDK